MKLYISIVLLLLTCSCFSQSIRKDYKEMTQSEKDLLVDLFYDLRTGADLIDDLAVYHNNNFGAIHFNLPGSPQNDVFLAWHRRQIFEVEQAMQDINPRASIPFWDWTVENSTTSDLWDQNFMGSFNTNWNLQRNLGGLGSLPSTSDVNSLQAISNWLNYSNTFERGIVHTGAHNWVGGDMATGVSPRDPVFYLHHGMVDKLWQDWVVSNNITPASNIYQITSMPRYDGTYTFNGTTLPSVNPDDIVDAKAAYGIFFAENQLATLDDYTVSNTYNSRETFYYQYKIVVGNGFTVPNGTAATVESVNDVVSIEPGFSAPIGAEFIAKIDEDNDITTKALASGVYNKPNTYAFADVEVVQDAYLPKDNDGVKYTTPSIGNADDRLFKVYPNPSRGLYTIESAEYCKSGCTIEVFDVRGSKILEVTTGGSNRSLLDLQNFKSGVYILTIKDDRGSVVNTRRLTKL